MPSRSLAPLAVLLALLLLAVPAASHGSVPAPDIDGSSADELQSDPSPTPTAAPAREPEHLNTTFRVTLQRDGDARWRVEATFNRTDSFDSFASRFEDGETAGLGYDTFRTASERTADATGREMTLRNVERTSTADNGTGTLVLGFTWSNFSRTDGDRLNVSDGFETRTGTWFPELDADQSLEIVPPPGYGVQSAPVGVEGGVARWEGPRTFTGQGPWIVYERGTGPTTTSPGAPTTTTSPGTPTTTTSPGTPTTTTSPGTPTTTVGGAGDGLAAAWPVALLVLLAAASVAVYTFRDDDGGAASGTTDGSDGGPGASAGPADRERTTDAADDGAGSDGTAGAEGDGDDGIDEALLSDEERVERLLERNGGRMKQATIVRETGWSNAKVSQLLSAMAEEDRIDKLRIGRENLISFPDEDITDLEE